jgi:hypothetical protein
VPPRRDFEVVDLRALQPSKPSPEARSRYRLGVGGRVLEREPQSILGIGLHQTAIRFAVSDEQTRRAGGDPKRAKDLRALGVAAPVVCWLYPPGPPRIVITCPLRWHVNHGNGLNAFTVGYEVEADLPGRLGPAGAYQLTEEQVACARQGLEVILELGRDEGMPLTHLWAHRQSHGRKPGDPGQEIWERLVVQFAEPALGLRTELERWFPGSTRVTPDGRPIPQAWDPRATARYQ